jgi:hypothetical protein
LASLTTAGLPFAGSVGERARVTLVEDEGWIVFADPGAIEALGAQSTTATRRCAISGQSSQQPIHYHDLPDHPPLLIVKRYIAFVLLITALSN